MLNRVLIEINNTIYSVLLNKEIYGVVKKCMLEDGMIRFGEAPDKINILSQCSKKNVEFYEAALREIASNHSDALMYSRRMKIKWTDTEIGRIAKMNIANDAKSAVDYIYYLNQDKWDESTDIGRIALITIANNADAAYDYAKLVLNRRWPKDSEIGKIAEMNIAKSGKNVCTYTTKILKRKWEDTEIGRVAENTLSKYSEYAYTYAKFILKSKWPEDTKVGRSASRKIMNTVRRDAYKELPSYYSVWRKNG